MKMHFTKKVIYLLIILMVGANCLMAQSCDCSDEDLLSTNISSSDGFESYPANQKIPISGRWSIYPSGNGYFPSAATVVSSPTFCGNRSLKFEYNSTNVDMLYSISGDLRSSFLIYVPYQKGGTVSLLSSGLSVLLTLQLSNGICSISNGESFTYPQGSWFRISFLQNNNGLFVFRNYDNVTNITGFSSIGYVNFDANTGNEQYYIDKLCTYEISSIFITCSNDYDPVCLNQSNIVAGNNSCDAYAYNYFLQEEFHSCSNSNGSACEDATPINCGQTILGTTEGETFKFYRPDYGSCLPANSSNDFTAPDKVYKFTKTDNSGDIGITLVSKKYGVDLDVFLVDECGKAWSGNPQIHITTIPPGTPTNPNISCIASGTSALDKNGYDTDFIEYKNLPAGEYYIIIDGQHWQTPGEIDDVGQFELTLTCKDLVCSNATSIQCNETKYNQTMGQSNNVSVYCSPSKNPSGSNNYLPEGAGCIGKERVYTYTANKSGPITITLSNFGSNVDLEMFLIKSCDHTVCLAHNLKSAGQEESITYDVIAGQTYQIVVDAFLGQGSNFDIGVSCCDTPQYVNCASGGKVTHYYSGDGNNIRYNFTSTEQLASGYQWLVRQNGNVVLNNGGNATTVIVSFNNPGSYEVCYPRINSQGCVEYCCYPVTVENPFNCNTINYVYDASSNSFSFTAQSGGSNGQWLADNGTNPPTVLPGGNLPVPGTCIKRTISYRYFDGTYWRYCCRNIWICNPFTCGNDGNISYSYTNNNQFNFSLNNANQYNNIQWQVDGTNPISIGTGANATWYPNPGQDCRTYTITVKYFDPSCNCWRICCRSIYICNPFTCSNIGIGYRPSNDQFTFTLNGTTGQTSSYNWTLDENNTQLGSLSQITYIPPSNLGCNKYTYSIRYWDGFTWRICCLPVYICDPYNCGSDINHSYINGQLTLGTNPNYTVLNWYINDDIIGAVSNVNQGSFVISVLYYDNVLKQYKVCKKPVVLTATNDSEVSNLILHPNPTTGMLQVESEMPIRTIMVYGLQGNLLLTQKESSQIDLGSVTSGMYLVKIVTSQGDSWHKVIKIE